MSTDTPQNKPRSRKSAAERKLEGQLGGLTSWSRTTDRRARMETPQAASPRDIAWHAKKLGLDPDNLTPDGFKRAEAARKAYFARLRLKGLQTRRLRKQAREAGGAA